LARILPLLLVLALLASTAAAFAVTEGLKLQKSPIARTNVDKLLAPASTAHPKAYIDFFLRKRDRASVVIVDGNGNVVRSLGTTRRARRGHLSFVWNGRDASGDVLPDGSYQARVHLRAEHRTILLPNVIRLDATAPRIQLVSARPRVISPDGDYRDESVRLQYRTNEPARVLMYLDGAFRVRTYRYLRTGKIDWGGGKAARSLPAGRYRIRLRAIDRAGNLGPPSRSLVVRIRYIELRPHVVRAKSGTRFGFRVLTEAKSYSWHLGSRGGVSRRALLILRAASPGRYRLVVAANGHVARGLVVVTP
jgi:hypothetical protein